MFFRQIYDPYLAQAAYLIGCQRTGEAVIIDPERDVDRYIDIAKREHLRIVAATETHIHADFLSGVREFVESHGARGYLSGEGGDDWQSEWALLNSSCTILRNGDTFRVGNIEMRAAHTPGHTPEHMCFFVTDVGGGADAPMGVCSGDFLFVGDVGRPDLLETAAGQQGAKDESAETLFETMKQVGEWPDWLQVWPGHGAGSACGKALGAIPQSTVGYEKRFSPALRVMGDHDAFVGYVLEGQPEPPVYFARMKKENREGPKVLNGLPLAREMSAEALAALDTSATALVDTRKWAAFRDRHLAGSLWAPVASALVNMVGSFLDATTPVLFICDEAEADLLTRMLVRIGMDEIVGYATPETLARALESGAKSASIKEVTAGQLQARLDQSALLDVRRATEFAEGHIEGATNIAHTRLTTRMEEIPSGQPIVVNCLTGVRSGETCAFLQREGYDVTNLARGWTAWLREQAEKQAAV
jgi:hydroxyacylglutathione hydrolase